MMDEVDVYLGLGTNLGDRESNLWQALKGLDEAFGASYSALSRFHETEPWGFESENSFLNAAVKIETELSADEVLKETQNIEREMGRMEKSEKGKYKDRIIDIDILMYGTSIIDSPNLTIPHKFMKERRFVLEPLAEIASEIVIPGTDISVSKALNLLIHKAKSDQ